ncbi:hypothetical protein GEV33_008168 [Tenebrio molitor]|uniref:Uncharacterized protein n=1 Tax=Tenebrio molitor TaxID=7067 RepID=A0A8J6HJA2_TENMO|nr:hypothetical protein GEV33_008168 [Tenebrio molitor]
MKVWGSGNTPTTDQADLERSVVSVVAAWRAWDEGHRTRRAEGSGARKRITPREDRLLRIMALRETLRTYYSICCGSVVCSRRYAHSYAYCTPSPTFNGANFLAPAFGAPINTVTYVWNVLVGILIQRIPSPQPREEVRLSGTIGGKASIPSSIINKSIKGDLSSTSHPSSIIPGCPGQYRYCSSNLRWPLRMRRKRSAMQDVEPRCDKVKRYFYGWCTVLETLGPWCLPDKKLVVPREKLERQRLKMLFFSPLMTTVVYLKNYIYRDLSIFWKN